MEKISVGVVFGGMTVEHEVSIISALQAIASLDKEKYRVVPLYISKNGQWYSDDLLLDIANYRDIPGLLAKCRKIYFSPNFEEHKIFSLNDRGVRVWQTALDVVLPVVHGTHVEDGCLQGLMELCGIPYGGPAVLGSACGMDKIVMKAVLKEADIPVVNYLGFYAREWRDNEQVVIERIESRLHYPLIVKPANLGSSIGIGKAKDREALIEKIEEACQFAVRILVEEMVEPLREINCAVLGEPGDLCLSLCEEPITADEILSFSDKYLQSSTKGMSGAKRRIPADLSESTTERIRELAARAFTALDCRGVCRIDFLLDPVTEEVYVNELNTIPGSLSFYLFEPMGLSYKELLERLIKLAIDRKRDQDKLSFVFESNILAQGGFKGKK